MKKRLNVTIDSELATFCDKFNINKSALLNNLVLGQLNEHVGLSYLKGLEKIISCHMCGKKKKEMFVGELTWNKKPLQFIKIVLGDIQSSIRSDEAVLFFCKTCLERKPIKGAPTFMDTAQAKEVNEAGLSLKEIFSDLVEQTRNDELRFFLYKKQEFMHYMLRQSVQLLSYHSSNGGSV